MSLQTQKNLYSYISGFVLIVLTASCCLIDIYEASTFKYCIFASTLLAILFSIQTLKSQQFLVNLKEIVLPWLPWVVCTVILIFVHGTKNLTQYLNAVLMVILIFSAMYRLNLKRRTVLFIFAICLLLFDVIISAHILQNGPTGNLVGTNRNELLAILTFINAGLASHFVISIHKKDRNKLECIFLGLTVLFTLIVTVMTEVRNAILAYGSCAAVFLLFGKKNSRKFCLYFGIVFVVMICMSFATGRMQQGIQDIQQLQQGNSYSSWGLRIEMWKMVLRGFQQAPLFGWGNDAPNAMMNAGITFPIDWRMNHFHSDFFIALATGGLTMAIGWVTSMICLIKSSIKDLPRLCVLASILSTGLVEQNMFEQNMLFPFVIFWALFCVTDPLIPRNLDKKL